MNLLQWQNGQANPEVIVNENFNTLDSYSVYARNKLASSGLTWNYFGGRWGGFAIAAGSLTLSPNSTNYIVVERSTGVISVSTSNTNWNDTTNYGRVYLVNTGASGIASDADIEDHRIGTNGVMSSVSSSGGVGFKEVVNWEFDTFLAQPTDVNKYIRMGVTGAKTFTITSGFNFSVNDEIDLANRSTSGDLTIVPNGPVTLNTPKGGSNILEPGDKVTIKFVGVDQVDIFGSTKATTPPAPPPPPSGDPFFSNVTLLMHMDDPPGLYIDSGPLGLEPNYLLAGPIVGGFYQFGNSSARFTSDFQSIDTISTTAFDISTGDFTIECWIAPNSSLGLNPVSLFHKGTSSGLDYALTISESTLSFNAGSVGLNYTASPPLELFTFSHVAIVREGDDFRMYINGNLVESNTFVGHVIPNNSNMLTIGDNGNQFAGPGFTGSIDEFRFTKGVARYSGASFTVPTEAFPNS